MKSNRYMGVMFNEGRAWEMEAVEQSNHHGRCETNIRLKTEHDGFEVNVARTVSHMILSTKKW
jgi:hypothetical protein